MQRDSYDVIWVIQINKIKNKYLHLYMFIVFILLK